MLNIKQKFDFSIVGVLCTCTLKIVKNVQRKHFPYVKEIHGKS